MKSPISSRTLNPNPSIIKYKIDVQVVDEQNVRFDSSSSFTFSFDKLIRNDPFNPTLSLLMLSKQSSNTTASKANKSCFEQKPCIRDSEKNKKLNILDGTDPVLVYRVKNTFFNLIIPCKMIDLNSKTIFAFF